MSVDKLGFKVRAGHTAGTASRCSQAMMKLAEGVAAVQEVADDAAARLRRVREALVNSAT